MRKKDELSKADSCMNRAHPQEMAFVLLSRDAAAPVAIRAWIAERLRLGKDVGDAIEALATMEAEGRKWVGAALHYPQGMGAESRRLHRKYNQLVEDQRNGVRNGAEVIKVTDECAAKGIILVPGGEDL
jgi:hypothetical protein